MISKKSNLQRMEELGLLGVIEDEKITSENSSIGYLEVDFTEEVYLNSDATQSPRFSDGVKERLRKSL